MASPLSETVSLLTEILVSHERARATCLAAGDAVRAAWHQAMVTRLRAAPPSAVPMPELPVSVRLPRPTSPPQPELPAFLRRPQVASRDHRDAD